MPLNVTFDCNFETVAPIADSADSKCPVKLTSFTQNSRRRVSMPPKDCSAVEARRLRYQVGRGKKAKVILSGINMTVPEGAIYGLLGPSGSGKTTLLKSVVGQLTPSEGWVKVFGFQPNQPGSQIPGPAIGYMPQELAVYEDFTIKETLWYFGRLYKVSRALIKERIEFLLAFLDLPSRKRLVGNLSGGQKRRVSLASALVHSPPLLILDEPTVGVDPLLRQSIWKHLVTLTQTEKITVIVTTHYIEEASRANIVGLMRRGKLLAENNPADLLAKHGSTSLEDVFLKLCVSDTMRRSENLASMNSLPVRIAIGDAASDSKSADANEDHSSSNHNHNSRKQDGNSSPSSNQCSSLTDSEGTTVEAASVGDTATTNASGGSSADEKATSVDQDAIQQREQPLPPALPFGANFHKHFRSILKLKKSNHASNIAALSGNQPSAGLASNGKQAKHSTVAVSLTGNGEKRRQSGSHFIEQLMSEYREDQSSKLAHAQRLSQMLTCDTGRKANASVPQIQIHSTDSKHGQTTNQPLALRSSTNRDDCHSPVSHRDLLTAVANAGYHNSSYQASECGSAYSVHALPSSDGAANNSINEFGVTKCRHGSIELDPELFLDTSDLSTMSPGNRLDYRKQSVADYLDTVGTITWKNYIRLRRNVPLLSFQFLLPAIQVVLFCICVGNDPFDIPVAVVNEESSADSIAALSTKFLSAINPRLVRLVNYTDLPTAIESVRDGINWGVIHVPENFTISMQARFAGLDGNIDEVSIENSTIKVYPDMTNQPIGHAMEVAFRQAYTTLSRATFDILGINTALSEAPIRMETAIYGQLHMQNYLQYMSPGVLISISYIMATGLTSLAFIMERRDGSYDRTLAAGVDQIQMLISHAIVQLVVMVVQISLVVFFTFVIYKVPTNGPFCWVFLLLLLQGLAGMSFGLMVSSICTEENTAIMMILGTFYPNLLLAGVIWPIEAIPYWLRWFSYLQPQTLPTQSLRDLIVRGWSIDRVGVWSGFAVTSIWLVVFLLISCISFKLKK